MSTPHINVHIDVHADGTLHFDPEKSDGSGYKINGGGDILRSVPLADEGGRISFEFFPKDPSHFEIVGVRLGPIHEEPGPAKRDTGGDFYGSTPFEVSFTEQEPNAMVVMERIRDGLVLPEDGWIYYLEYSIGSDHFSVDPRIYNDGSGSGPGNG